MEDNLIFLKSKTTHIASDSDQDYKPVWKRLERNILDPVVRDSLLLLIHNKLPIFDRLNRIVIKVRKCLVLG